MPRVQYFLTTLLLALLAGAGAAVSDSGSDDCSIFDTRTRRELARVEVGRGLKLLVFASVRKWFNALQRNTR